MSELKPCPFCGTLPSGPDTGYVSCSDIGFKQVPTKEWNNAYCWKRIDALEKMLNQLYEIAMLIGEKGK